MSNKSIHIIKHTFDFIILVLIIGLGLVGIVSFKSDIAAQIAAVVIMAGLYIFWGVYHHHHEGSLTSSVILEYIAMASLTTFILIIFLLRI